MVFIHVLLKAKNLIATLKIFQQLLTRTLSVTYLIFGSSPFTANQLKAHKSLAAYNQVEEGWVRDVKVYLYEDKRLVIGKVVTFIQILSC